MSSMLNELFLHCGLTVFWTSMRHFNHSLICDPRIFCYHSLTSILGIQSSTGSQVEPTSLPSPSDPGLVSGKALPRLKLFSLEHITSKRREWVSFEGTCYLFPSPHRYGTLLCPTVAPSPLWHGPMNAFETAKVDFPGCFYGLQAWWPLIGPQLRTQVTVWFLGIGQ